MSFIGLALLVSAVVAPNVKVERFYSPEGDVLRVTTKGKTYRIPELTDLYISSPKNQAFTQSLEYHGVKYEFKAGSIVNKSTGIGTPIETRQVECNHAIVSHDRMFWLLIRAEESEYGTSRPVSFARIYVMSESHGVPKLVKSMDILPVIEDASYNVPVKKYRDLLRLRGMGDAYGLLNLKTLGLMKMPKPTSGERPVRDVADAAISNSQDVYWQDGTTLKTLDWKGLAWKPVRTMSQRDRGGWVGPDQWGTVKAPHDWITAVKVGNDDLLISTDLVTFAKRKASYKLPFAINDQEATVQVFLKASVGIGIIWRYDNGNWDNPNKKGYGQFLSLPSLKPICPISL
jgi:hypothetical protein